MPFSFEWGHLLIFLQTSRAIGNGLTRDPACPTRRIIAKKSPSAQVDKEKKSHYNIVTITFSWIRRNLMRNNRYLLLRVERGYDTMFQSTQKKVLYIGH